MRFIKVHGLGNDFILVDNVKQQNHLPSDLHELAKKVCHRQLGIGADGLVLISPCSEAQAQMRIFNPDGSEAQMCGNAIRCVARYLYEYGLVQQEEIKIKTLSGMIPLRIILNGSQVVAVQVDMGEPRLERADIPMLGPAGRVINEHLHVNGRVMAITAVSMGNPHCIVFVPDVELVLIAELGTGIEHHSFFPERTNVEFVQVLNRKELKMRVWERGAGATLACGTGACAAAVAGVLNGLTEKEVTVHLALGSLFVKWAQDNHVYLTGPAEEVFHGEFPC